MAYLLFFCSGLSGLIYQVVWVRAFGLVFGNTIHSASLVIAVFMLGLGVGGYVVGTWADRRYRVRPDSLLRVFGFFEQRLKAAGRACDKDGLDASWHLVTTLGYEWLLLRLRFANFTHRARTVEVYQADPESKAALQIGGGEVEACGDHSIIGGFWLKAVTDLERIVVLWSKLGYGVEEAAHVDFGHYRAFNRCGGVTGGVKEKLDRADHEGVVGWIR